MNISVVGLGKLGLCTAACLAVKGHTVIGVDSRRETLEALGERLCPIAENGLEALLEQAWGTLTCTDDYSAAVAGSDITLIIVPTPSLEDGTFTNEYLVRALEQLAPALKTKTGFHVVDIVSTVMPGSCEAVFIPLLETLTGKRCGRDFGLVYNPEFIALGSVIRDFLNPDMVLIGASDALSADAVRELYASAVESAPAYAVMNLVNAEIAKLSLNCFVTMKISFANELAALCEEIPGAHVDVVTRAIGADSRVGGKYLSGGLGFAGPCFPRDNEAFQAAGRRAGYAPKLSPSVVAVNKAVPGRIASRLARWLRPGQSVALFGVAYKQDTHIIEESQSIMLAKHLLDSGYAVRVHDPLALDEAREALHDAARYCPSPYEAARDAGAVVLLTNWREFVEYDWEEIERVMAADGVVFDSWRMLQGVSFTRVAYCRLGVGEQSK